VAAPLVIWSTTPVSNALTPRVATSGVIPSCVIASPLTRPETMHATATRPSAVGSFDSLPLGYLVTMIVASVIIPATERSSPRCWMTSVWPIAAIARIAANGSVESRALRLSLPGASSGLTRNSNAVATQIAE
jgi:hypothetical protein